MNATNGKRPSPIGEAIRDVAVAIGGGLAEEGVAPGIDPVAEDAFWQSEISTRPYYGGSCTFEQDFAPAYAFGYYLRSIFPLWTFEEIEDEFQRDWQRVRGASRLAWVQARGAVRDAWERYHELNTPTNFDAPPNQPVGQ